MSQKKEMSNMTLGNIAEACQGTYIGPDEALDKVICGAVIDSRLVEEDYLFIPIRGERADGHNFIPQVFEKGACCVLSVDLEVCTFCGAVTPGAHGVRCDHASLQGPVCQCG